MNKHVSSKYLNFEVLSTMINSEEIFKDADGVVFLTAYGLIFGKLKTSMQENENNLSLNSLISKTKLNIVNTSINSEDKIEFFGDGSIIIIEDAVVKGMNNTTVTFKEFYIFSDQVIGFYPVNLESISNQTL